MNRISSVLLAFLATTLACSAPPRGQIPFRGPRFASVLLELDRCFCEGRGPELERSMQEVDGVVSVRLDEEFQVFALS